MHPEIADALKGLAANLQVELAALQAVVLVECAGEPWWDGRLVMRFEGHLFDRLLGPGPARDRARELGLASPKAGAVRNPRRGVDRYAMLERAAGIDRTAAFGACSFGFAQVLGLHAHKLGYRDAFAMYERCAESVEGQAEVFGRYLSRFGILEPLRRHDWRAVAIGYNGPKALEAGYHTKLEAAYRETAASEDRPAARGVAGTRILQERLTKLGYTPGGVDGVQGDRTTDALKKFQRDRGIGADGRAGPITGAELDEAEREGAGRKAVKVAKVAAPIAAGVGALGVETISSAVSAATDIAGQGNDLIAALPWLPAAAGAVIVAALVGVAVLVALRRARG